MFLFEAVTGTLSNVLVDYVVKWTTLSGRKNKDGYVYVIMTLGVAKLVAIFLTSRKYFENSRVLRLLKKVFDVRKAVCGSESDKPVLLASITNQFAEGGDESNALDRFNASVRNLLARQVVTHSGRILPYSMVVCAHIVRFGGMDITDLDKPNPGLSEFDIGFQIFGEVGPWLPEWFQASYLLAGFISNIKLLLQFSILRNSNAKSLICWTRYALTIGRPTSVRGGSRTGFSGWFPRRSQLSSATR